jgi:hypothetical protein
MRVFNTVLIRSTSFRHRLVCMLACSAATLLPVTAIAAQPDGQTISKELLHALHRDLGLDAQQVAQYIALERKAIVATPQILDRLGPAYAGSWLERGPNGDYRLMLAATEPSSLAKTSDLPMHIVLVKHNMDALQAVRQQLDTLALQRRIGPHIDSWHIDPKRNAVAVSVRPGFEASATDLFARYGIDRSMLRLSTSAGRAEAFNNIIAGERYELPALSSWCSVGFPVIASAGGVRGYLSAGHCNSVGQTTTGTNSIIQGNVAASVYPLPNSSAADYAWIQLSNSAWTLQALATNYAGGFIQIVGAARAPVGSIVCKSGARTQYSCGSILADSVTQVRGSGTTYTITNLVETNTCAGKGDSGGPFFTPSGQAQGITSGGTLLNGSNDNCSLGTEARTVYQPVQAALDRFGVHLFVGAYAGTAPAITAYSCSTTGRGRYQCTVQYTSSTPANANFSPGSSFDQNKDSQPGSSTIYSQCKSGLTFNASVTVSNAFGTDSRTLTRTC